MFYSVYTSAYLDPNFTLATRLFNDGSSYREIIKTFVETGTYQGATSRMASQHFDKVITFEIKKELYEQSKAEGDAKGHTNITYYLGDTVVLLKEIISLNQKLKN